MSVRRALPPGATLGVLGGGQLGRMFVHAAQTLGFDTLVLDPDKHSPAGVAAHYAAVRAVRRRARAGRDGRPLRRRHHRVRERAGAVAGLAGAGHPRRARRRRRGDLPGSRGREGALRARRRAVRAARGHRDHRSSSRPCADDLLPGILKTARLGYDGKGQVVVADRAALAAAWAQLRQVPCVLEKRLPLQYELSIIVARGADGALVNLPVQQNLHRSGILALTTVPAPDVTQSQSDQAIARATAIAESMDYVGVLCVEFFVLQDGSLVANEMAPRPHNSGHYSIDACDLSQFELQVRTLAGLPLVTPRQHSPCEMVNLLGDLWFDERPRARARLGRAARAARHAPAPVRQEAGAAGPQDGPPHGHRRHAGARARACERRRRRAGAAGILMAIVERQRHGGPAARRGRTGRGRAGGVPDRDRLRPGRARRRRRRRREDLRRQGPAGRPSADRPRERRRGGARVRRRVAGSRRRSWPTRSGPAR